MTSMRSLPEGRIPEARKMAKHAWQVQVPAGGCQLCLEIVNVNTKQGWR